MIAPTEITFGEIVYPPGSVLGPRLQRFYQLVLVHRGSLTVWIDGALLQANPASVILLFPGHEEYFEFARNEETEHTWVHIALPELPRPIKERLKRVTPLLPLSSAMHALMRQLLAQRNSTLATIDEIRKTIAAQMLWCYLGEGEARATPRSRRHQPSLVERAQNYANLHLTEPLTLDQLAQAVATSPAHLIRLFRTEVGVTPLAYVWQQRVKMGIELLEQTGLTVDQIAQRCGFKTSYHFSRRVKEATGLPPSQVRRQAWQQGEEILNRNFFIDARDE